MGDSDPILTYGQLIAEVRRLCAQRQTGWLFITTSDNHSVRFGLQNGAIVALIFRSQTGLGALASIQRVLNGSLSFSSGPPDPKPQAGLPPSAELLALLQSAVTDHPDGAEPGSGLLDEALAQSRPIIEAELVEHLGPMARLVIDEHLPAAGK